jgi:hypothetical protein
MHIPHFGGITRTAKHGLPLVKLLLPPHTNKMKHLSKKTQIAKEKDDMRKRFFFGRL